MAKNITIATIGIPHIMKLKKKEIHTIFLGGIIRWSTEAVTGNITLNQLEGMYFDQAFIGTNGIHAKMGFTTTNEMEAAVKSKVIQHSEMAYILADSSKFNKIFTSTFCKLDGAIILSDSIPEFNCDTYKSEIIKKK